MKNFIYLFSVAMILSVFSSCAKDDLTGDSTVSITAGIVNSPTNIASASSSETSSLNFITGYVWVSEIVFDGSMTDGTTVSKSIERFSKVDFATGVSSPSLDDVIIPMGTYNSIDLGIELRDEDSQPSIVMEGTYTRLDETSAVIRFEYNSGETFEAESEGTSVQIAQTAISKITFDPSIWFDVISAERLDNATVNSAGEIVISGSSNAEIFDDVADRLDVSTQTEF